MVSKKLLMLGGLFAALSASPAFAQENNTGGTGSKTGSSYAGRDMTYRGESYDVLDSSYVPKSRRNQHRKFLNNQYNFPAKPRSMWEIGIGGGLYNISGDVPSQMLWNHGGYGFNFHVRKALGYVVSLRLDYDYGVGKGLEFQPSENFSLNPAWTNSSSATKNYVAAGGGAAATPVYYNYRMESHQLNLDMVFSTNNIRFNKARSSFSFYGFAGVGGLAYQTWVNTVGANGADYTALFAAVAQKYPAGAYADRGAIRDALRNGIGGIPGMDNTYETAAESQAHGRRQGIFGNHTLDAVASYGVGVQFRLSKRVNLSLEDRITTTIGSEDDLLDGQRWAEQTTGQPVLTTSRDGINYFNVGLNFNIGGGGKNVEPLYWLNPLDYSYGELSSPRHMVLPEPILSDADGDGIADQFDKCPGTPAGVAVDSHGCPMDTDGDGVPDDRDKQLITPTECQPVDADGVGKCPCNCPLDQMHHTEACGSIGSGSIMFSGSSSRITPAMQAQLATLAAAMQANPTCHVVVMGNGSGSKIAQQRSWDRVNAVIEYMSEKNNISRDRFIFRYDGGAAVPENGVMYRSAMQDETGDSNVAPPHPNLRHD